MTAAAAVEKYPDTPELDKQSKVIDESRILSCFLDWLNTEKGISLVDEDEHWIGPRSYTQLLADYYEIDLDKVEAERREVIDYVRRNQKIVSSDS